MDLNAPIRLAYQAAHLTLRSYWFWRRPQTSGALAAVWKNGKVLLVKNSYRRHFTLPGGYVKRGEDPREAAARELYEETRMRVSKEAFTHAYHGTKDFEFRKDTLDIYEAHIDEELEIKVDAREVIWADYLSPAEARAKLIVPHLREYLDLVDEREHAKSA